MTVMVQTTTNYDAAGEVVSVIVFRVPVEDKMTPTDAQIKRAARAMTECMFAPHELPITGELWDKYLWTAKAALTAAAEVGGRVMDYGPGTPIGGAKMSATEAAAIERCAQVVREYSFDDREDCIAAIRALKEKQP